LPRYRFFFQAAAERCGIMRLVDRRFAGIAKGVGTQKIIGRVHMTQVQIEDQYLASSFSILEEQPMDMLLGLDMLKRHQCNIDLKENVLVIGSTGFKTRFLPEAELPDCGRLSNSKAEQSEAAAMKESAKMDEERQMQQALQVRDYYDFDCARETDICFYENVSLSKAPADDRMQVSVRTARGVKNLEQF
jgi:hypothetical protein